MTREPGGGEGAEAIRRLLLEGDPGRWDGVTETLLLLAARSAHCRERIRPALERGGWVISDRFLDSTFAYQGGGQGIPEDMLRRLSDFAVGGTRPDLTLVLDLDPAVGTARAAARERANGSHPSRFERMEPEFHRRVREAYLAIAARESARCRVVDASGSEEEVAEAVWSAVRARFFGAGDGGA